MLVKMYSQREKKFTEYVNRIKAVEKTETIYEDLYMNLTENLEITKADLGEYFLNEYLFVIKDSFAEIDEKIIFYLGLFFGEELKDLEAFHFYKPRLEKRINELLGEPQQPDNLKIDEVKKEMHNNIFVGNSFDVWQSMFKSFGITEESRTDVKFMFEEMKKESLIYKNVSQVRFLEWIAENYNGMIIEKTSNHSRTKTRIAIYETAKTLYKN